mmetsp:Transcript_18296/g.29177  ORF Transcript_18296/g.29177 Transcript_18296/m.29177 type:complete len:288 (+) Transcript_18296:73-936(+)
MSCRSFFVRLPPSRCHVSTSMQVGVILGPNMRCFPSELLAKSADDHFRVKSVNVLLWIMYCRIQIVITVNCRFKASTAVSPPLYLCQEVNSDGKPGSVISSNVTSASTDEKLFFFLIADLISLIVSDEEGRLSFPVSSRSPSPSAAPVSLIASAVMAHSGGHTPIAAIPPFLAPRPRRAPLPLILGCPGIHSWWLASCARSLAVNVPPNRRQVCTSTQDFVMEGASLLREKSPPPRVTTAYAASTTRWKMLRSASATSTTSSLLQLAMKDRNVCFALINSIILSTKA